MILIYGKGKVGASVASLCDYLKISYEICDDTNSPTSFEAYEYIVPSPGIPASHRIYQTGKIMAELDFAYQFLPKSFQIISITGTDGKSTTSWIMYNILEKEYSVKLPVYLSGNFDIPFSSTILEILQKGQKRGFIVIEISSFMSFAIRSFKSDYTIFTNLKSDHLNWHADLQEYVDAKMNLLSHTTKKSILNQQVISFAQQKKLTCTLPRNVRIYQNKRGEGKDYASSENIIISGRKKYSLSETHFSGEHNAMNILSAGLVANEMKICSKRVRNYLREIHGLPHRLEIIGNKNGIVIVEDSKSTSSQSLGAALSSFGDEKNLLLIVGGSDKGDSFEHLSQKFVHRVKAMACIGATKNQFQEIGEKNNIPYISTDSLEEAVSFLFPKGISNDVLMLSPGCASFGLFRDYLDRANQFREIIKKLPNGSAP